MVSSYNKRYVYEGENPPAECPVCHVGADKEPEEHHEEGEEGHDHKEAEKGKEAEPKNTTNFEKIEIVKGVSNMGYTAITFVNEIPKDAVIVTKGAFFINAKLSNTGGHEH